MFTMCTCPECGEYHGFWGFVDWNLTTCKDHIAFEGPNYTPRRVVVKKEPNKESDIGNQIRELRAAMEALEKKFNTLLNLMRWER